MPRPDPSAVLDKRDPDRSRDRSGFFVAPPPRDAGPQNPQLRRNPRVRPGAATLSYAEPFDALDR